MTTGNPSPFFQHEDLGEAGRRRAAQLKITERIAAERLVKVGDEFIRQNGPDAIKVAIEQLKIELNVWNGITGSTLRLSLSTVDLLLQVMSTLPFEVKMPQLINNHDWQNRAAMLAAIRNYLKKQIADKVQEQRPDLSTGNGNAA